MIFNAISRLRMRAAYISLPTLLNPIWESLDLVNGRELRMKIIHDEIDLKQSEFGNLGVTQKVFTGGIEVFTDCYPF